MAEWHKFFDRKLSRAAEGCMQRQQHCNIRLYTANANYSCRHDIMHVALMDMRCLYLYALRDIHHSLIITYVTWSEKVFLFDLFLVLLWCPLNYFFPLSSIIGAMGREIRNRTSWPSMQGKAPPNTTRTMSLPMHREDDGIGSERNVPQLPKTLARAKTRETESNAKRDTRRPPAPKLPPTRRLATSLPPRSLPPRSLPTRSLPPIARLGD